MSDASVQNLQTAAAVAAAASVALANPRMDAAQAAQALALAVQAAGPLVNPNVTLAASLGAIALNAVHVATEAKTGLTHDDLLALFGRMDEAARELQAVIDGK